MTRARDAWTVSPAGKEVLDACAGPFETSGYRGALEIAKPEWADVTVAAMHEDGTRAFVPLMARGGRAVSMPYGYGGVHIARSVGDGELAALLDVIRAALRARRVELRSVPGVQPDVAGGGVAIGTTHVVHLAGQGSAQGLLSKRARQSMRRAQRAGAVCSVADGVDVFLRLYVEASARYAMRYPERLLRELAVRGVARAYDVTIDGEPVASALALIAPSHWMYWLAAQNERGRTTESGYLAAAALLEDAVASVAPAVNLGASAGLPGVAFFKERLGGVPAPILASVSATALGGTEERLRSLTRAVLRRRRG